VKTLEVKKKIIHDRCLLEEENKEIEEGFRFTCGVNIIMKNNSRKNTFRKKRLVKYILGCRCKRMV
jgi:hypothetical protein